MKVYVNRFPKFGAWGGGMHATRAFHKFLPNFDCELVAAGSMEGSPDVILLAGLENDGEGISAEQAVMYKMMLSVSGEKEIKLVLRVNENDARKATNYVDNLWCKFSAHVDGAVFVSHWLKDYFEAKGWDCKNNTVIYNGVNSEIFKPGEKLNNGKINIVSSHWSDNAMKGQDITEWVDDFVGKNPDDFTFTFIGRTKAKLKNGTLIHPLAGKALGAEIGKYDVCINGSRFDPGPNSVIEPISCGLPTYVHSDGGGGVEFVGRDHVFSSIDELSQLLTNKKFTQNTTSFAKWEDAVKQYADFFKNIP